MKHLLTRVSAIGATAATAGLVAIGGVAAASPQYSSQTSARGSAYTSSWSSNQENQSKGSGYRMSSNWNMWSPTTYSRNHDGNFNTWWNGMMRQSSSYSSHWSSNSNNNSWKPSGNNWQQSWGNWNPMTWEMHGSSYSNWHTQFMNYMNSHKAMCQTEFNSSHSYSHNS